MRSPMRIAWLGGAALIASAIAVAIWTAGDSDRGTPAAPPAREASDSCPVTAPNPDLSVGEPAAGSPDLFVIVQADGISQWVPQPTGGGLVKFGFGTRTRIAPGDPRVLLVSARHLESDARVPETASRNGNAGEVGPTGLNFPRAGCWRVTARFGTRRLDFVTLLVADRGPS